MRTPLQSSRCSRSFCPRSWDRVLSRRAADAAPWPGLCEGRSVSARNRSTASSTPAPASPGRHAVQAPPLQAPALEPAPGNPVVVDLDLARRHHRRAVQGSGAGLGGELPRYASEGFYAGHDLPPGEPGFMIQGGGYTATMVEKPTRPPIQNEATNGLSNARGTLAMARTRALRSATSQFYINVVDNRIARSHGLSRRATSATPSSAACSPAWTSSTASPPSRPRPRRHGGRAGRACDHQGRARGEITRAITISPIANRTESNHRQIAVNPISLVLRPLLDHLPDDLRQPGRLRHHHPAAAVLRGDVRRVAARHRPAVRLVFAQPARRVAAAGRSVRRGAAGRC